MVNFECLKFGKKLGSGGYGEIVLAADDNNNKYAVKKISKAKSYLLDREIAAGRMLNNDSIVHFKGTPDLPSRILTQSKGGTKTTAMNTWYSSFYRDTISSPTSKLFVPFKDSVRTKHAW